MELEDFYDAVEARLDEGIEVEADDATHAVLAALSSRLSHDEAEELGAELPEVLGDTLASAAGERPFERDAFVEDIASRLDLDDVDAERVALAVLGGIRMALEPRSSVEQVIEALPTDLAHLMHSTT